MLRTSDVEDILLLIVLTVTGPFLLLARVSSLGVSNYLKGVAEWKSLDPRKPKRASSQRIRDFTFNLTMGH